MDGSGVFLHQILGNGSVQWIFIFLTTIVGISTNTIKSLRENCKFNTNLLCKSVRVLYKEVYGWHLYTCCYDAGHCT